MLCLVGNLVVMNVRLKTNIKIVWDMERVGY